ncbi:MAG TPA: hypothetical protein VLF59_03165 [Candidatus Saccharimonadales bacterium]|nr:hypothetical protein [Candidatus Saccharimonadales bacterium]
MVVYNPENNQIGLDTDEELFASFGLASGDLMGSRFTDALDTACNARDATSHASEFERARDGKLLWLEITEPEMLQAISTAIGRYGEQSPSITSYLDREQWFDTNNLGYRSAVAERAKAEAAAWRLSNLFAALYPELTQADERSV